MRAMAENSSTLSANYNDWETLRVCGGFPLRTRCSRDTFVPAIWDLAPATRSRLPMPKVMPCSTLALFEHHWQNLSAVQRLGCYEN